MALQILRFVAAAMVVEHHSTVLARYVCPDLGVFGLGEVLEIGAAGVDIFFVISGFVIATTGPLSDRRPTGTQFFWRRWSRVAPLFLLMTIPTLLVFPLGGPMNSFGAGGQLTLSQTISTVLFWPAAGRQLTPPYLSAGWTLCLEMLFYSFVSLILVAGRVRLNLALASVVIIAFTYARTQSGQAWLEFVANPIFLEFAAGCALAVLFRKPWRHQIPPSVGLAALLSGASWFAWEAATGTHGAGDWLATLNGLGAWTRVQVFGIPATLTVFGALVLEPWARGATARGLAKFGDASYSIYLVHMLVLLGAYNLWMLMPFGPPAALVVSSGLAVSVLVGRALYLLVERPLQAGLRKLPGTISSWRVGAWPIPSQRTSHSEG